MSYVVTGPLVIAKNAQGQLVHLYEGAALPDSVPAKECERLEALGLVGKEGSPKASASKARTKGEPTEEPSE